MKKQPVDLLMAARQKGITLIELIIFMVIVGVAMAGIISAINYNVQHSADPVVKKQALAIAEALLEEVMLQNFSDPNGGANVVEARRDLYDDVSDYNGYCMATTGCAVASIRDINDNPIPNLDGYTAAIAVSAGDLGPVGAGRITSASGAALHITVTVTGPLNTTVLLEGYRTNYGA
jgi:MSHA pilin protein MshD